MAGLHRLTAAKKLGWKKIECRRLDVNELQAELAEIDENLIRNKLTVLERAEHLSKRKDIYEALHPETGKPGRGKNQHVPNENISVGTFAEDTAKKTKTSRRTVEQEVKIARDIGGDVKEKIRGTAVENRKADLLNLSRMDADEQEAVADKIAAGAKKVNSWMAPELDQTATPQADTCGAALIPRRNL